MSRLRELPIYSHEAVAGGAPLIRRGAGYRVIDLINRLDAGDSIDSVARDAECGRAEVELLLELRDVLAADWRRKAEHRLAEWRLRLDDALTAECDRDEAEAAKEMWRDRALKAEADLEKVISG